MDSTIRWVLIERDYSAMLGDFLKIPKDLVDRGPDSPGVVRLVRHLVQLGKAGMCANFTFCNVP